MCVDVVFRSDKLIDRNKRVAFLSLSSFISSLLSIQDMTLFLNEGDFTNEWGKEETVFDADKGRNV